MSSPAPPKPPLKSREWLASLKELLLTGVTRLEGPDAAETQHIADRVMALLKETGMVEELIDVLDAQDVTDELCGENSDEGPTFTSPSNVVITASHQGDDALSGCKKAHDGDETIKPDRVPREAATLEGASAKVTPDIQDGVVLWGCYGGFGGSPSSIDQPSALDFFKFDAEPIPVASGSRPSAHASMTTATMGNPILERSLLPSSSNGSEACGLRVPSSGLDLAVLVVDDPLGKRKRQSEPKGESVGAPSKRRRNRNGKDKRSNTCSEHSQM